MACDSTPILTGFSGSSPDQALCALAEEVPSVIAGNDRLLASLFRAVTVEPPLDCVRAGYFARLAGTLLTRCGEDLLAFLEVGLGH